LNANELDAGYFIIPVVKPSVDDCCQHHDQEDVDDSGLLECLAYEISNGVMAGVATTVDHAA